MSDSKYMANRLREVVLDGKWVANTNIKEQLTDLDWQLSGKQFGKHNNIAVLAQHIHYYIAGITMVFTHNQLEIRDQFSFDFATMESSKQWEGFQNRFWKDTEILAGHIETLKDGQLNDDFTDKKYGSYRRNINGIIEHCYYHLGQIVLIKKLLLENHTAE